MKKIIIIQIYILTQMCNALLGQQEPQTSLYINNPILYNPAFAGTFPYTTIQAGTRFQWVGIKGAPITQYLSFNSGFKKKNFGFGAHFINDIIGARMVQSAYVNFGYNVKINRKNHKLAFGLSGGIDIEQLSLSNLYVNPDDVNDPLRTNEIIYNPNFGVGIYYYGDNFFAGASSPRILQNQLAVYDSTDFKRHNFRNQHIYVMGGYQFNITNFIKMRTSAMVKLVVNAPVTFDLTCAVILNTNLLLGINYRFHESIGINANFKIGNKWIIGYAYDFPVNDFALKQWGSHEIMLGLNIGNTKGKSPISCFYF